MNAKPDFRHIESCLAVTDDVIEAALAPARSMAEPTPRAKTLALIERMAEVAKPGRAAPKILVVLAHLALKDWLDGLLRVRLIGDPEVSVLELLVDDGLSSQRIMGPLRIDVPFDEFRRSLEMHPEFVLPLMVDGDLEDRRVELYATPQSRSNSFPPGMNVVADSLIPMMGESGRKLPPIVSRVPPAQPKQAPAATPPARHAAPPPPNRPPPLNRPPPNRPPPLNRPAPPVRPAAEEQAAATARVEPPAPELVVAANAPPVAAKPEAVIAPREAPEEAEQKRYKPVSLPPHMKEALSSIKKKS
jgi:hypothetical protein